MTGIGWATMLHIFKAMLSCPEISDALNLRIVSLVGIKHQNEEICGLEEGYVQGTYAHKSSRGSISVDEASQLGMCCYQQRNRQLSWLRAASPPSSSDSSQSRWVQDVSM